LLAVFAVLAAPVFCARSLKFASCASTGTDNAVVPNITAAMRVTDQRYATYDFVICVSPASLNGHQLSKQMQYTSPHRLL
jgi:hypothetical protein